MKAHILHNTRKLTATELADVLHVSLRTIQKWTQSRKIPCFSLSKRCVRYDLEAVERAIKRYEKQEIAVEEKGI